MEGKATFTLTEAKTGKVVRQVTEHNMVTDAVKRILNPPAYTLMNKFSYSEFLKNVLPMYNQLFGGIMLLGNELEERADNVMPGKDLRIVATAGDAYSGTNVLRGSRNDNECYPMENGYHFTWDFGTDKANGTIKCAALTSRVWGNTGAQGADRSGVLVMDPVAMGLGTGYSIQAANSYGRYIGTFQKKTHTYYYLTNSTGSMMFTRVKCLDPSSVGITDSVGLSVKQEPVFTKELVLPFQCISGTSIYYDPKKKYLYFFSQIQVNDGEYSVEYAGVSMDDFTVKEHGTYKLAHRSTVVYSAAFYDGKFFICTDTGLDIYSSDGVIESTPFTERYGMSSFACLDGMLVFLMNPAVFYLYLDSGFLYVYNASFYAPWPGCDIPYPYVMMSECFHGPTAANSINPCLGLAACYFATINNLSEPLVKTSEHTLKITYDITN